MFLTVRIEDAPSATILQFVSTFGVWMLAEHTGLSAIITMVVYAMTTARIAPRRIAARNRVSSYSVWETAVFVLNVVAFVLMGSAGAADPGPTGRPGTRRGAVSERARCL